MLSAAGAGVAQITASRLDTHQPVLPVLVNRVYYPTRLLFLHVKARRPAKVLAHALGAEQTRAGPRKRFASSGTKYCTNIRESEGVLAITSELSLQVCRFCSRSSESL